MDELVGLLKSSDHNIASELAEQLNVSSRTLMRDLGILRDKGYPIETDQGRGGGIRLHRLWGIGRLHLNYRDVIDLLLSLAIMEKIRSPIFLGNLKSIRHKIAASFPQAQRDIVQSLRKRILIGDLASETVLSSNQPTVKPSADALYEAFFDIKTLTIEYRDGQNRKTHRTIEPHYLYLNWPVWYVLAWDNLRGEIRHFRLDRISKAPVDGRLFKLKSNKKFIEGLEEFSANL